ncbi:MAG: methyltransferase domain-containing protein [Candidatus Heimdallarchaeota archaeon]
MTKSKEIIKKSYASALKNAQSKTTKESCCTPQNSEESSSEQKIPKLSLKPVQSIPSFGCIIDLPEKAGLKEGDVVVDFGSGPGHDLIRAAEIIGPQGKAIGIDMTPEMIQNATNEIEFKGLTNAEVRLGEIENVPVEDNIADVVISNCVINLTANKSVVFKEAYRILKPGGRLVDADVIAREDLPQSLQDDNKSWCSCIGGALTKKGYSEALEAVGFIDIKIEIDHSRDTEWQGEKIQLDSGIISAVKPL